MKSPKTLSPSALEERRTRSFVVLSAIFFGAMVLLNVIGLTRFVQMGPLALAVGVLPYPLTFLVTDLISEIYGKDRANFLVWVGLGLNLFVLLILFVGQSLPSVATMIDRQRRIEAQGEVSFTTCSQAPRRVLHSIGGIEGPMSSRLGRTTKGGRKNRKS